MEKKVVSLRAVKYEKLYREFYGNILNRQLSVSCFFKSDVVYKKTKTS